MLQSVLGNNYRLVAVRVDKQGLALMRAVRFSGGVSEISVSVFGNESEYYLAGRYRDRSKNFLGWTLGAKRAARRLILQVRERIRRDRR